MPKTEIENLNQIKQAILNSECTTKEDGLYATYLNQIVDKRIAQLQEV